MPWIDVCKREQFEYLQLVGFVLLVIGTVLYNEVVVLPFGGFNEYTKDALKRKKLVDEKQSLDTMRKSEDH